MKLDIHFSPPVAQDDQLRHASVVLIDVLRSTTSMCHGMAAGCHRIMPVADLGQVTEFVESLGRANLLLGGERDAKRIPGFDLGNSPAEYMGGQLRGSNLVMLTSNGTLALSRMRQLRSVVVASFANLGAVARWLAREEEHAAIVCAGHGGRFCLEDAVCAGMLARQVMEIRASGQCLPNDAARVGLLLEERHRHDLCACLAESDHGRTLISLDLGADLALCAQVDVMDLLPFMVEGQITLRPPASKAADTEEAGEEGAAQAPRVVSAVSPLAMDRREIA